MKKDLIKFEPLRNKIVSGKSIFYDKLFIEYRKLFKEKLSYLEYCWHLVNRTIDIKKCKFSGKKSFFNGKTYLDFNEEYFKYIKFDNHIKVAWLKWKKLFEIGLTLEDAEKKIKDKFYQNVRLYFAGCELKEDNFINFLVNNDFTYKKAIELYKLASFGQIEIFDKFVIEFSDIITNHNNSTYYWLKRGWTNDEAVQKIKDFSRRGQETIKVRRKNEMYDTWYKNTRKNGSNAVRNVITTSKIELKIIEYLKKENFNVEKYYSPCVNIELRQIHNKKNFVHDLFVDNCIIEYNGTYWHKDFINIDRFTKNEYMYEIKKAFNCLYEVNRKNCPNYILLWENDFKNAEDIVTFLKDIISLKTHSTFYSSREIDYTFFNEYINARNSKRDLDSLYKDILIKMRQKSHCESYKVSAIASCEGRIVATGINGTLSKSINCDDYFKAMYITKNLKISYEEWKKTNEWKELHHEWSVIHEVHAEQNMIGICCKNGYSTKDLTVYISLQPCIDCAKILVACGIKEVVYLDIYPRSKQASIDYLNSNGVIVRQIEKD